MQLALSTWQEVEDYLRTSRGHHHPDRLDRAARPERADRHRSSRCRIRRQGCRRQDRLPGSADTDHRHVAASSGLHRLGHAAALDADRRGRRRRPLAAAPRLRAVPVHQRPWRQRRHRALRRSMRSTRRCRLRGDTFAGALQDGVLVVRSAVQGPGGRAVRRRQRQPRHRRRGLAGTILSPAGDQARADVAQGRAAQQGILRQRRLPAPLPRRPYRVRSVAVLSPSMANVSTPWQSRT